MLKCDKISLINFHKRGLLTMNIIKTNKLDNFTKEKIIDLITICKHHDNINGCIFLEDEINYLPNFPCYIYCLEADKLIGFLSVFISGA